jgi:hypothetical protein
VRSHVEANGTAEAKESGSIVAEKLQTHTIQLQEDLKRLATRKVGYSI